MEINLFDIIFIIFILAILGIVLSRKSYIKICSDKNKKISGGKIIDNISKNELSKILENNNAIKDVGKYIYNFPIHKDEIMRISSSVIT